MRRYLSSRGGCSFTSVLGFCNGVVTREHLEIRKQIATLLIRLKDVPAAHYTALVSDGDWKLLTWIHTMLLSAEILLERCVTAAKYGPMHLTKVCYFCSHLSSVFKMAYTSEFLQFLLSGILVYLPFFLIF